MRRLLHYSLFLTLLALLCSPHGTSAGGDLGWQQGTSDLIGDFVSGPTAAVGPDDRIYLYSGLFQSYDLRTRRWTPIPIPPTAHAGPVVVAAGKRIYLLCGYEGPVGHDFNGDLRSLNVAAAYVPSTRTWHRLRPTLDPCLDATATAGPDGRLYVFGGGDTQYDSITAERFEPYYGDWQYFGDWEYIAPPPNPLERNKPLRLHQAAAVTGSDGRIYLLGGEAYDEATRKGTVLNSVEIYSPTTNTWSFAPSMPIPRRAFAAVAGRDGRIYVIGGTSRSTYDASDYPHLSSVNAYCPRTRRWSAVASLPIPSAPLAAVMAPDGRMYAIDGNYSNQVYTYSVPSSVC